MIADFIRRLRRPALQSVRRPGRGAVPGTAGDRERKRSILLAAGAVIVIVAIATPFLIKRTDPDIASVPLRLSVLDHRVPLGPVAAGALGDTLLVHPGEGSLAATVEDHQVFLVAAVDDRICIVIVREKYGSAATGCGALSSLLTVGVVVYTNFSFDGSGPGLLFVAVPDGYTHAHLGGQRTSIVNNLAVVPLVPDDRDLGISGPEVPTATLDLDYFLPPGFPDR